MTTENFENTPEFDHDLIERYLDNTLNAQERSDFEAEMAGNPDLVAEVQLHRELQDVFGDRRRSQVEASLQKVIQQGRQTTASENPKNEKDNTASRPPVDLPSGTAGKVVSLRRKLMAVAAVLFILILGGYGISSLMSSQSSTELYAAHFQLYPSYNQVRISQNEHTPPPPINKAFTAYDSAHYDLAIQAFKPFIGVDSTEFTARFYTGVSHLALQQPDEAIAQFEYIIKDNNNAYVVQSQWYLSLAFLLKDDHSSARNAMIPLLNNTGKYGKEAKDLYHSL